VAKPLNLKRDRFLFYVGVILLMAGGPGLAAGSFVHDAMRVPIGGAAYGAFGWVNQAVLGVGAVLLIVGIVLVLLALRGGVLSAAQLAERKAGGSRT